MENTNLINVENLKGTIDKIKSWVLSLYPLKYTESGGTSKFSILDKVNGDKHVIDIVTSAIGTYVTGNLTKAKIVSGNSTVDIADSSNHLTMSNNTSTIDLSDDAIIEADDAIRFGDSTNYLNMNNASGKADILAQNKVVLNGDIDNLKTTLSVLDDSSRTGSGELYLKEGVDTGHNRLIVGVDRNIIKPTPNGIYLGSEYYLGYTWANTSYPKLVNGTTFADVTGKIALPNGYGCYLVTYEIGSRNTDAVYQIPDGKQFRGAVRTYLNGATTGKIDTYSMSGIKQGATYVSYTGGSTVITCEDDSTNNQIAIAAWQNSGDPKETVVSYKITKLA